MTALPGCGRADVLAERQEPGGSDHRTWLSGGNGATQAARCPAEWRIPS